ncbi:uncharacterized protein GIQ15_04280 [Arthroderma uncinatum]|uniref:uncharacterized protein n=1 Tax=Arthroderma uncinatum TaxID=74035 RepID=UPI00144A7C8F|nr:uncharacterized protein GIQ15_04280 [Arthroderma uncinatum]KAF3481521.1 hypothetical protein GIQ15_04280 [Arthroderma uncinatum]
MSRRRQRRRDSSGEGSSDSDSEASTASFCPSSAPESDVGSGTDMTSPYLSGRSDDGGASPKKTGKPSKAVRRPVRGNSVSRRRIVIPAHTVRRERAPGNGATYKQPGKPSKSSKAVHSKPLSESRSDTESEDPDDDTDDDLSSNDEVEPVDRFRPVVTEV